jgi:hypothetical protein
LASAESLSKSPVYRIMCAASEFTMSEKPVEYARAIRAFIA